MAWSHPSWVWCRRAPCLGCFGCWTFAASAAIPGAGALVAGSVTRGVTGQPAANRTHAELKNDLNKTGEIYVHTCEMFESNP